MGPPEKIIYDRFILNQKMRNYFNLKILHSNLLSFVAKSVIYKGNPIIKLLGRIKNVRHCFQLNDFSIKNEYSFIFYMKEDDEDQGNKDVLKIDENKKVALVIHHKRYHYVELKENKVYNSYKGLIQTFSKDCLIAIGEKKNYD